MSQTDPRAVARHLVAKLMISSSTEQDIDMVVHALADAERRGTHETPQSIADWANGTFGPATVERQIERAEEEWAEYYAACERGKSDQEKAEEVADTIICLSRVLVQLGYPDAVDDKMTINRARTWKVGADGCAYHVKAQADKEEK